MKDPNPESLPGPRAYCLLTLITALGLGLPLLARGAPVTFERGPHHRVVGAVTEYVVGGVTVQQTNSYVQLATGMHYWDGEWKESVPEVTIVNGAAVALKGRIKAIFSANLNTWGAIDLQGPSNKRFRSHLLGLAYRDCSTGQSVLIAGVKDCDGAVLPPNQVIYLDALDGGFVASVVYTYTRSSFEQDIVIEEQPPSPADWGLNPATSRLEVWTEFVEAPEPVVHQVVLKSEPDPLLRQTMVEPDLIDQILDFGNLRIGAGVAFALNGPGDSVPTGKSWELVDENRLFLVEKVDYTDVAPFLQNLPQPAANIGPKRNVNPPAGQRGVARTFPPAPRGKKGSWQIGRIAATAPTNGFVIDYVTLDADTNDFVFEADQTYHIEDNVNISGDSTLEGGAVIKFKDDGTPTRIQFDGAVLVQSGQFRPVFLTASDDDTVGQTISGSSGSPSGLYGTYGFKLASTTDAYDLHDLRIRYLTTGIKVDSSVSATISHAIFSYCETAIEADTDTVVLNALIHDGTYGFDSPSDITNRVEHLTAHRVDTLRTGNGALCLTNSLLISVTNGLVYAGTNVHESLDDTGYFQTVKAGKRYLAENSVHRNAGTTNINAGLAADLRQRTTYPPLVLDSEAGEIKVDTTLFRQASRDTDLPDLGYAYDPIDWILDTLTVTNATLTLQHGVVVASYTNRAFWLQNNSELLSLGRATRPNYLTRFFTVQEVPTPSALAASTLIDSYGADTSPPTVRLRFTQSSIPSQSGFHLYAYDSRQYGVLEIKDSAFHGTEIYLLDTSNAVYGFTNNLFNHVTLTTVLSAQKFDFANNLFLPTKGYVWPNSDNWTFYDNLLTNSALVNFSDDLERDYNAFYQSSSFYSIYANNTHDLVLTSLYFETFGGWKYYQPTNSSLINTGSVTADLLGLYHYTATTNQVKETNTTVDVGIHRVALDGTGAPVDTDGDGVPDYLEDGNGNGTVDSGETRWDNASDPGLKVWITQPGSRGIIP